MNKLQLRKQALILESDLNRLALRAECQNLRSATGKFRFPGGKANWLLVAAPVAGFLATRWLRPRGAPANRWLSLAKWLPMAYSVWRGYQSFASKKTGAPPPPKP